MMPFSQTSESHTADYWTRFYECFLKPQIESRKYACRRSKAQPESIVKGILRDLYDADLVVAVLTDHNANVWYELGIRHALRIGTVMLIEEGQRIPFDISAYGVLTYEDSLAGLRPFASALDEFIAKVEQEHPVDSPVYEFLGPSTFEGLEAKRHEEDDLSRRRVSEAVRAASTAADSREFVHGFEPRILWVDDNPSNNEVFIEEYRSQGVRFDLALSTEQALQLLDENKPQAYMLIISDMGRGLESDAGLKFLEELRKRWTITPAVLIFCGSRAARTYGKRAKDLGAVEVTSSVKDLNLWIQSAINSRFSTPPIDAAPR